MDLEFKIQRLECYETAVDTVLYQEETADSIVPDSCPDIVRIVDVCGQPFLTKRSVQEGKGELAGHVKAVVLYQPEEDTCLRKLEIPVPFQCTISGAGIGSRAKLVARPTLQGIDARVLNPRKVLVRVNLAIEVKIFYPEEKEFCCGVEQAEELKLEQLEEQHDVYFTAAVEEKSFSFSDELPIGSGRSEPEELMCPRVTLNCTESKIIGNKLIFKGDADLHLMYRMGGALESAKYKLPFSQLIEVAELGERVDCAIELQLTELECSLGGDGGNLLYVSFEVLAQAILKEQRSLGLVRDVYSTTVPIEADYGKCQLLQRYDENSDHQNLQELVTVDGLVKTVLDTRVELGPVAQNREGSQILFSVPTVLQVLYLDGEDVLRSAVQQIHLTSRTDCPENSLCDCRCEIESDIFAAPVSGGAEVRFAVNFQSVTAARKNMVTLNGARVDSQGAEESTGVRPSIVLRQMERDECLWDVAKSCCTTRTVILNANELGCEDDCRGRMLLIPRVR